MCTARLTRGPPVLADGRLMRELWHLIRRFFAALPNRDPSETDRIWVESMLSASEYALWARQYPPDRRHSASVARQVERELANRSVSDDDTSWVAAAALLHDIGKIEAGLGTWGRVPATVVARIVGPDRTRLWIHHDGWRVRVSSYLSHPEIGADLLRGAQSDPRVIAWAAEHHQQSDSWTIAPEFAEVLHEFDND